ncbi:molybdenum cofactor biosynthesis protein [Nocardia panacis]|uniref:Molybdopterin molybdenumtransferase n=2 Tax=Nocardia panacis TaxID=2340916 RepID=A0A3A4K4G7_9NOCA|nr:molybdenum cofactor biosynthesis protein [Nocardia panacis]
MKALVPTETVLISVPGIADCDTDEAVLRARAAVATGGNALVDTESHGLPVEPVATDGHRDRSAPDSSTGIRPERDEFTASGRRSAPENRTAAAAAANAPSTAGARVSSAGNGSGKHDHNGAPAAPADPPSADRPPLSLDEARDTLRAELTRLVVYHAELHLVRGATLAEPLRAAGPLPRFDVSAMDGYAVAGDGPWRLRRDIGFAGGQRPVGLLSGEAVRIATGAHVPDGTTAVVRDEFARVAGETLSRRPDTPVRDDIRHRGEDRRPGDLIADAGTPIDAMLISAAASVEVTAAPVRGPVRSRLIMTGDEIRSAGPLQTGQTRDSIGPILPDLLSQHGIRTIDRTHLRDTPTGFDEVLAAAAECDLLVVVGATGGGAADQLRAAVARAGARILVPRLRLRPGGSTLVAALDDGPVLLGLPGNPFAAVAALTALAPAIVDGLTARRPSRPVLGPLHNAAAISGPVPRVVPVRGAPQGGWFGDPNIRTAHLGGLIDRDGLAVVPPDARDGDPVEFLPLRP